MKPSKAGFVLVILLLLACRLSSFAPHSHGIEGDMVIDTRTATPLPSPTFTPSPTISPTPTLTPVTEIEPFLLDTGIITATTVQTTTVVVTEIIDRRSGSIHQMAWSPDGDLIAAGTSTGIYTFDAKTFEEINVLGVGESINSLLISPNIGLLVSGETNGDIQWRDAESGWVWAVYKGHSLGITDLALSDQGNFLVSGSDDRSLRLWSTNNVMNPNVDDYMPLSIWEVADRVTCVDIRWDGQVVVAGSYENVLLWDAITGEEITTINGFSGWIHDIAFDPDGLSLAVVDSSNHLQIWDTTNWEQTHNIEFAKINQFSTLTFSLDGEILAIGSDDGTILLLHLAENIVNILENYPHKVTSLDFNPEGSQLVSSYQNGVWRIWNFATASPSEKGDQYEKE